MVVQVISATPILCPTRLGCEIQGGSWGLVTGEAGLGLQFPHPANAMARLCSPWETKGEGRTQGDEEHHLLGGQKRLGGQKGDPPLPARHGCAVSGSSQTS